jgi:PAT family beta-lactamase induction signal transducer AmpG
MVLLKNQIKGVLFKDKEAFYTKAFMAYMDRDKIGIALAFIILMRTGESMLTSMVFPFMVDLGIKVHYGWISGGAGLPFSIMGAMLGGWLISRYTLKKTILPFLLAQNLTNLIYMSLALGLNRYIILNTGTEVVTSIGNFNLFLVASVNAFDQFAGGLGTSVLVTFLMRSCLQEFKAAHFAVGTGLMNISGVLSGVLSGFLAQWLGYGYFFGISFLASLPGMFLIFFIPFLEVENNNLSRK